MNFANRYLDRLVGLKDAGMKNVFRVAFHPRTLFVECKAWLHLLAGRECGDWLFLLRRKVCLNDTAKSFVCFVKHRVLWDEEVKAFTCSC